jgi:hypothetical protein
MAVANLMLQPFAGRIVAAEASTRLPRHRMPNTAPAGPVRTSGGLELLRMRVRVEPGAAQELLVCALLDKAPSLEVAARESHPRVADAGLVAER